MAVEEMTDKELRQKLINLGFEPGKYFIISLKRIMKLIRCTWKHRYNL